MASKKQTQALSTDPTFLDAAVEAESGDFEKENYLKGNREPRADVREASEASARESSASVASRGPGGRKRAPAPGKCGATTHPYSPKVPVVAQLDSAPAGGAPPPPAARGGLSQREEAAAQVSVSRGQRRAPGGAGCKGNSLVPCAPWRRQIHHHRRGGARGGNEGEALARRPGPSRSTRPEHRRDCCPGSPQLRDPQA